MKKRVLLLLLPLLLGACSNKGESPLIKIDKLYVKPGLPAGDGSEENYANQMDKLPALKVGDEVQAFLLLDGNGADLQAFTLQNDDELATELIYEKTQVSTEGNLTDAENGQLRFKDGVAKAQIMVRAVIQRIGEDGGAKLGFYLSSKAECEGAQEEIELKTEVEGGMD